MTDLPAGGARRGAPPTSTTSTSTSSSVPHRSSYASVLSGTALLLSSDSAAHLDDPAFPNSEPTPNDDNPFGHLFDSTPHHHRPIPPPYPSLLNNTDGGRVRRLPSWSGIDAEMQTNSPWKTSAGDPLPSYSRKFASFPRYDDFLHRLGADHPDDFSPAATSTAAFLTPSYLRNSRYISRLEAAHRADLLARRHDDATTLSSFSSFPSYNPTAASLFSGPMLGSRHHHRHHHNNNNNNIHYHRMAPSHRGMTHDIIEKPPPGDDDEHHQLQQQQQQRQQQQQHILPLPSRWSDLEKHFGLELSNGGLEARYTGPANKSDHEAASVRADNPMPPQCGIYYFEITILSKLKEGMIGIGVSSNKASVERLPGWEQESWAYHGDDGKTFFGENPGQGRPYGPTFGTHDTVGCGVNFSTGSVFFTKNGIFLGNAFRELRDVKLYPSVGVKKQPGVCFVANFGQQPFIYDIDGMVKSVKHAIRAEIGATDTSNLQPPLSESALLHELVAQFLAHDGYVETARAFAEEVATESAALQKTGEEPLKKYEVEDDVDAINRQKIRAAILEGDIDKAFKYTNAYYADVLQDKPHIQFKLRCRKFLEMMRRCSELSFAASKRGKAPSSSNGTTDENAVFDQEMELDEHMHDGDDLQATTDEDGMDTEEPDPASRFHQLLTEAVEYGQQLRMDYPSDEKGGNKKLLDDIFSLVAYPDPRKSVHGHYLNPAGRATVAEELNSAILASLGKSSSAALGLLYQQTEVLVNEISEEGGAGAFINTCDDFLL